MKVAASDLRSSTCQPDMPMVYITTIWVFVSIEVL